MVCDIAIMNTISVAHDFSETPIGRYPKDDKFCGANFRDNLLIPKLQNGAHVQVRLDEVEGYGSSFLEEAFGGLVRAGFTESDLRTRLSFYVKDPCFEKFKTIIWSYISDAQKIKTS